MLPTRYGVGSTSRKSRLEGKPSMLPKPRRPGSTDRQSTDTLRPSTSSHRSSSAEPARGTFGAGRHSREASVTKLPQNGRSRSQTGDAKYANPTTTPLRNSQYSRPTTTPVRTPTDDRSNRSWQMSLERALAFVTIKDLRPISNMAWQRAEYSRVSELLAARGELGAVALIRPLTIAKFVEITGMLLNAINGDTMLNNDNYVTKLPHLCKRLLYPGAVSKSWLRTVNTLHAFPHALALIGYVLDILNQLEMPVLDEVLYVAKDELAELRRDYLYKCWIRFQDPGHKFEDLNEEHLQNLTQLLGNNDEKIEQLQLVVKKLEESVEDEAEVAARAAETRLAERREALAAAVRAARGARRQLVERAEAERARRADHEQLVATLDVDVQRANVELERLRSELDQQSMSIVERTQLLDQVDYMQRVVDSKRTLADQITKMVLCKENDLALWQKLTLDCCVEYKQALVHLSAPFPKLVHLTIDEKDLMEAECAARVSSAVDALKEQATQLSARRAELARSRTALARKRAALLDESRAKILELKSAIQREQETLDSELARESTEASAWSNEQIQLNSRLEALRAQQENYAKVEADSVFWVKQDVMWRKNLLELKEYVKSQKEESQRLLVVAREKRTKVVLDTVKAWNDKISQLGTARST